MFILDYERNKDKLTFRVGEKTKYTIGTKIFPLSSKKNIGVWDETNTSNSNRIPELVEAIDMVEATGQYKFQAGKCYTNADVLSQIGKQLNLDIQVYSGWLFPTSPIPVHHCWNVLNGNIIIDMSTRYSVMEKGYELTLKMLEEGEGLNDAVRQEYVAAMVESEKFKISEDSIYGKVPESLVYIGTNDTVDNARTIFNKMLKDFPNHPAYKDMFLPNTNMSKTQELMIEKNLL